MPWVIGIDEAGYGPNLGPLVQAAAMLWTPADDPAGWRTYSHCVRRVDDPFDHRLVIDDSKRVYQGAKKLAKLERTVLALTSSLPVPPSRNRFSFRQLLSPGLNRIEDDHPDVVAEHWYDADLSLPLEWDYEDVQRAFDLFCSFGTVGMAYGVQPLLHTTSAFNRIIDQTDNKAAVASQGLINLLKRGLQAGRIGALTQPDDPILMYCDKQGGRHYYAPLLQDAFPDGWIVAECETPQESHYRIENIGRQVSVIFRPKADADSVAVALASMTAKYVRELCMKQFNAFWAKHVPGLKPTAGYPVDAKRFYAEIEPAMKKLGIPKDAVWRKK
jgi:hypothetical protein